MVYNIRTKNYIKILIGERYIFPKSFLNMNFFGILIQFFIYICQGVNPVLFSINKMKDSADSTPHIQYFCVFLNFAYRLYFI